MTVEQAFNLIVQVTGEFKGNRQDHKMITEALEKIKELITPEVPAE